MSTNKYELNAIAKAVLGPLLIAPGMFWAAGTLHWTWGWAMNGVHLAMWVVNTIAVAAFDRELLAERGRRRADTQPWDKVLLSLFGLVWLVELTLAALDVRYGWTTTFPLLVRALGAVLLVLGFSLLTWAMVANRHFEPGVRIQRDREHSVVSAGPYRFVRHPGYTGTIAAYFVGMPCMLGSHAGLIAGAVGIVVLVVRTAKEDAFLMRELAGYASYAARVHYRLLPLIYQDRNSEVGTPHLRLHIKMYIQEMPKRYFIADARSNLPSIIDEAEAEMPPSLRHQGLAGLRSTRFTEGSR